MYSPNTEHPIEARHATSVLYIEDSDLVREMIADGMSEWGYRVIAVASAEAAERYLADPTLQLLIADVFLPGASGIDFAERFVRERPHRFALLSTGADLRHVRTQLARGIGIVAKPFSEKELQAAIDALADGSASA